MYYVSCSECDFEESMESVDDILNRQVKHRRRYSTDHVLEFEADQ